MNFYFIMVPFFMIICTRGHFFLSWKTCSRLGVSPILIDQIKSSGRVGSKRDTHAVLPAENDLFLSDSRDSLVFFSSIKVRSGETFQTFCSNK